MNMDGKIHLIDCVLVIVGGDDVEKVDLCSDFDRRLQASGQKN